MSVQEANAEEPVVLTDWKVDYVNRETEGDFSTYHAVCTSEQAHPHDWQPGAAIQVDIQPKADADLPSYHFEFTTEDTKKEWYDYAKVWENSVVFEQVK